MILTCPACSTQYVVKDGAIPPQGRQVRCASCKHSWHQDPEEGGAAEQPPAMPAAAAPQPSWSAPADEAVVDEAPVAPPAATPAPDQALADPVDTRVVAEAPVATAPAWAEEADYEEIAAPAPVVADEPAHRLIAEQEDAADYPPNDEVRSTENDWASQPYVAPEESYAPAPARRRWPLVLLVLLLLAAGAAAALWFAGPPALKQQLGLAAGETPLKLMVTSSDRQRLQSGNELFAVSGRVINPTGESHAVPPIKAELRDGGGKLVYSWTIAPPAASLPPGGSATFNSAEVDVPQGADRLTVTLARAAG